MTISKFEKPDHVLVVDDDPIIRELLSVQLLSRSYRVSLAESGDRALEIIKSSSGTAQSVDIVLLDLIMNGISGLDVLVAIKKAPELAQTRVIMLTSSDTLEDKQLSLQHGADEFISKPWDFSELDSRIQQVLKHGHSENTLDLLYRNIKALRKGGQALLNAHSLDDLLRIILGELKNVVDYDSASIVLMEKNHLRMVAHTGFHSKSQIFSYKELAGLHHIREVIQTGLAVIISDTFKDGRWLHLPDSDYIYSWMGIPLIIKGEVIGVLNIDSGKLANYSHDLAELATGFALQASLAIDNTKMVDRLERQSRLAKALVNASHNLTASKDIETQPETVWEFASKLLHAPMFYIGIINQQENSLDIKLFYDMGVRQPEFSVPLTRVGSLTLSGYVAVQGVPIRWRTEDEKNETIEHLNLNPSQIGNSSCTGLMRPLISDGDEYLGVLYINYSVERGFSGWERQAAQAFASQASLAYKKSQTLCST